MLDFEQIDKLKVSDVLDVLLKRLSLDTEPEDKKILEDELERYKVELRSEYQAFLVQEQKKVLKLRLSQIKNISLALSKTTFYAPNAELVVKEIVEKLDYTKVDELEAKALVAEQELLDIKNNDDLKKAAKEALKNVDFTSVTTIAALKAIVKNLIEALNLNE